VVESADLRERDDGPELSLIHPLSLGSILLERQMGARTVVVAGIRGRDPARVALGENNGVFGSHRSLTWVE